MLRVRTTEHQEYLPFNLQPEETQKAVGICRGRVHGVFTKVVTKLKYKEEFVFIYATILKADVDKNLLPFYVIRQALISEGYNEAALKLSQSEVLAAISGDGSQMKRFSQVLNSLPVRH